MELKMIHKAITYTLDLISGTTFLGAILAGNVVLAVLGGLASIAALINHVDQIYKRNKKQE